MEKEKIKNAIDAALDFVKEVYAGQPLNDLALEEFKLSEDERHLLVTVGFRSMSYAHAKDFLGRSTLPGIMRVPRDLKQVRVNLNTGEVEPVLAKVDA